MRKLTKYLIIGICLIASVIAGVLIAQASDGISPTYTLIDSEGNVVAEIWEVGNDKFVSGDVEHYCSCGEACAETLVQPEETHTPVPTDKPTSVPTMEPTLQPTRVRTACNRGLGNGSENCDPGNSGGKPGNAGEEHE